MRILAIDPGNVQSAYLILEDGKPSSFGILPNEELLGLMPGFVSDVLAIELMQSFGMAVGQAVFDTQFWAGRFVEAFNGEWHRVYRKDVKMHLCQSMRAKDKNIRQRLIDKFGGRETAVGKKASPGPLYGISKDVWSALAIGITHYETSCLCGRRVRENDYQVIED